MDAYSSGEDVIIKTRKPYTITKQRERWTEEEHNRFLEALKLYGRTWQRIEEHIGTKTAVQIRSHAQKFFSKLEKEALVKGIPIGQSLNIDIPPPRPKRKPSNPYPRKIGVSPSTSHVGPSEGRFRKTVPSPCCQKVLDLEREPFPEGAAMEEKLGNATENRDDTCSEVFNVLQEAHCSSICSANKKDPTSVATNGSGTFREFVPPLKEIVQDNGASNITNLENTESTQSPHKSVRRGREDYNAELPMDEMQTPHNFPRHVPVHVLGTAQNTCFHPTGEENGRSKIYANPAAPATTTAHHPNNETRVDHQSFAQFHPPFASMHHNHEDYRSFLHISSTFSSMLVSTLLQNPAAHAAASFAATYWPFTAVESTAVDSPLSTQTRQVSSTPSMAALAAATVAAATAWWAAHGLLPLCGPLHAGFSCTPPSSSVPSTEIGLPPTKADRMDKNPKEESLQTHPQQKCLEAALVENSTSKSPTLPSSDSEESGGDKIENGLKDADHEKPSGDADSHDLNKSKEGKRVDRSSCGSNTPSSSDVETDTLDKQEKTKEVPIGPDPSNPSAEYCNRRRSISYTSDSWKEVSEEGRLAFQALFSRNVLPQSFSPPLDLKLEDDIGQKEEQNAEEGDADAESIRDPNAKMQLVVNTQQDPEQGERPYENSEGGLLTIGLGHGKLRTRRTGFKPYKRCSMEAKEMRVATVSTQTEEKCPKRIRLEGDSST